MKYLMCLDNNYDVILSDNKDIAISDLEGIIDSMVYLLKSYMIEDSEIIDTIKSDLDLEIKEVEE
jgi:hypothetical protein